MKISKETRRQRAIDFRAFLARHSHEFTLKDVCEKADENYPSTSNAIGRLIKKNDVYAISDDKLNKLEQAAIDLADQKVEAQTA